jgi:hypothetical protein
LDGFRQRASLAIGQGFAQISFFDLLFSDNPVAGVSFKKLFLGVFNVILIGF